jgi:hypothetical protein
MYPWPIGSFNFVLDDALDIALHISTAPGSP